MSPRHRRRKPAASRNAFRRLLPQVRGRGDRTSRVNAILVDLVKKTETELEYWRVFQQYLVEEREFRRESIHVALRSQVISGYTSDQLVRIVDSRYQTRPLSSYGSIVVPPGGRFNFGEISSYHEKFQALYLASDFRTAASERFLRDQSSDDEVSEESLLLRLDPDASFSSYRIRVSDLSILDLRETESLRPFVEVIAEIDPPDWIVTLAKKFKQPAPQTIKTVEELSFSLFDPNFTQWGSLIDQPAVSQWFGYYAREAGIHGIIYPSVRHSVGFNLAVFPDSLIGTNARVELLDEASGVKEEDRVLDGSNARFHMQISSPMPEEEVTH